MRSPDVLYHASKEHGLVEIEPRRGNYRDPEEGPVIFAAADKAGAAKHLVRTDDSWVSSGYFNDVPFMAISDEKRFRAVDTGGTIYHLPGETFSTRPDLGMGVKEWTSKLPVKPITSERYDSGLELMLQEGVQVFFIDPETLQKMRESEDHGFSELLQVESENQRRGLNVVDLNGSS
jgi:hypothetical protein